MLVLPPLKRESAMAETASCTASGRRRLGQVLAEPGAACCRQRPKHVYAIHDGIGGDHRKVPSSCLRTSDATDLAEVLVTVDLDAVAV